MRAIGGNGANAGAAPAVGQPRADGPVRPRVVLIDPAQLTRESLSHLLHELAPDFDIEPLSDCDEAEAQRLRIPSVVLFNAKMADIADPDLKASAARLATLWPGVPRVVISNRADEPAAALEAIQDGWQGFFPATLEVGLLIAAVRLVISRGIFLPPDVVQRFVTMLSYKRV